MFTVNVSGSRPRWSAAAGTSAGAVVHAGAQPPEMATSTAGSSSGVSATRTRSSASSHGASQPLPFGSQRSLSAAQTGGQPASCSHSMASPPRWS